MSTKTQRLLQSFTAVPIRDEHRNYGNEGPYLRDFGIAPRIASALVAYGKQNELVCTFENADGATSGRWSWQPVFLVEAVEKHLDLFGEAGKADLTQDFLDWVAREKSIQTRSSSHG